jgi:hypothetical protein
MNFLGLVNHGLLRLRSFASAAKSVEVFKVGLTKGNLHRPERKTIRAEECQRFPVTSETFTGLNLALLNVALLKHRAALSDSISLAQFSTSQTMMGAC